MARIDIHYLTWKQQLTRRKKKERKRNNDYLKKKKKIITHSKYLFSQIKR